ncbi:MAG: sulfotransferase [Thermoplasmata archaeon]|nr:sulfotransferase [Thermoplasmata archaeon]
MSISIPAAPPPPRPPPGGPQHAPTGVRVVYVCGTHRSGATILGVLLSAHPEVFFAGELYKFPVPTWDPGRRCSCGSMVRECPFWTEVVRDFERQSSVADLRRGQRRYESWEALPRGLIALRLRGQELRDHAARMATLAQAIAVRSGQRIVVDASRSPVRGLIYLLARRQGVEAAYIHLVRDGRTYLQSELSRPGLPTGPSRLLNNAFMLAGRWLTMNLLALGLLSRGRLPYLRVRYEDLLAHPEETLGRIGEFLGVDFQSVVAMVRSRTPIASRHVIAGNRALKQSSTLTLWSRPVPPSMINRRSRWTFWIVAGWLAGFFGYRPRTGAEG